MFLKLWKHELRASGKLLGLLSAAALSLGVVGAVVLRLLTYLFEPNRVEEGITPLLIVGLFLGLFFLMIALMAYGFGVHIYLLWRFYKHKFTDEGYLTFTLPVRSHQIFFSALANNLMWSVIVIVVTAAAIGIALLFGTGEDRLINTQVLSELPGILEGVNSLYGELGSPVLNWLVTLTALPCYMVLLMTCITIGAVLAKKHKILAAFGIYYAVNMVLSIGQSILMIVVAAIFWKQELLAYNGTLGITLATQLLLAAGCCWLSIWLTEKKLNLP